MARRKFTTAEIEAQGAAHPAAQSHRTHWLVIAACIIGSILIVAGLLAALGS